MGDIARDAAADVRRHQPGRRLAGQQGQRSGARGRGRRGARGTPALHGPWGALKLAARGDLLHAVADEIDRRADDFIAAEVADTGKPRRSAVAPRHPARRGQLPGVRGRRAEHVRPRPSPATRPTASRAELRAAPPQGRGGRHLPVEPAAAADDLEGRPGAGVRQHGRRQAFGGNACHGGAARRGDEPRRRAPGRLQRRARLRARLGGRVPDDSPGHRRASPSLARHVPERRSSRRAPTASSPSRWSSAARTRAVVFADADLDVAIAGLTRSVFENTGQVCLGTERVYVQRPIFDAVVRRLAAAAAG